MSAFAWTLTPPPSPSASLFEIVESATTSSASRPEWMPAPSAVAVFPLIVESTISMRPGVPALLNCPAL